jgi:hypothetical protein
LICRANFDIKHQVDQDIAATNQIHIRKRRVFDDALDRKDHHFADRFGNLIGLLIAYKKILKPFGRDVNRNVIGKTTQSRFFNGLIIDVRAEIDASFEG